MKMGMCMWLSGLPTQCPVKVRSLDMPLIIRHDMEAMQNVLTNIDPALSKSIINYGFPLTEKIQYLQPKTIETRVKFQICN